MGKAVPGELACLWTGLVCQCSVKMFHIFCKKYEVLGLLYSESLTRCFEQLSPGVKLSGNCKVQCKLVSKCLDPVVNKLVKRSTC